MFISDPLNDHWKFREGRGKEGPGVDISAGYLGRNKKSKTKGRPATIHRCTGTYHIFNKLSRYLRYIYIYINKHGKALSSLVHTLFCLCTTIFQTNWREKSMLSSV